MSNAKLEGVCRRCNWPAVFLLCNGVLALTEPYRDWDFWVYCSNPTCENHAGEGVFQERPPWWLS